MIKALKEISIFNWIAGLILAFTVIFWDFYQQLGSQPAEIIHAEYDAQCDLRAGPCETVLGDGSRVRFAIEPRNIPVSERLNYEVTVSGLEVNAVSVDINGVDMKMPPNIVELKQTGQGRYRGKGALSFCTRSLMEWESVILVDTADKQIKVPFRFITSQEAN